MNHNFNNFLWFGENKNKGLGIFSSKDIEIKLLENYNNSIKIIVPLLVTKNNLSFLLLAVWANNKQDKDGQYIEQVWKAVNYYNELFKKENIIICGDFNSNKIWDRKCDIINHTKVIDLLKNKK